MGEGSKEGSKEARKDVSKEGGEQAFLYEPLERFGEGLTTSRPWNLTALTGVERLNGRAAMLGFVAALIGEQLTGQGVLGQLALMLRWLLG
jgi:hypothetical protein